MIGIHVCGGCGSVYYTLGPYWDCEDKHLQEKELELDLIRWYTESPSTDIEER